MQTKRRKILKVSMKDYSREAIGINLIWIQVRVCPQLKLIMVGYQAKTDQIRRQVMFYSNLKKSIRGHRIRRFKWRKVMIIITSMILDNNQGLNLYLQSNGLLYVQVNG